MRYFRPIFMSFVNTYDEMNNRRTEELVFDNNVLGDNMGFVIFSGWQLDYEITQGMLGS